MKNRQAKIKYADIWGLREEKYKFLEDHDVKSTKWQELQPKESNYFYVPKDVRGDKEYSKFISLRDIFIKYNAGIATGKDDVLVDFDKQSLVRKLSFHDKDTFELSMQSYKVHNDLINEWFNELDSKDINNQIISYNYRPFDSRFTIYNSIILQRSRKDIMNNFLNKNLGLCVTKQLSSKNFYHALITDSFIDRCYISLQTREVTYVFPLWEYRSTISPRVLTSQDQLGLIDFGKNQILNFKTNFYGSMEYRYGKDIYISPEEIFYYIYAILYSNIYRLKYQEFLKIDFPRIPFTKDYSLFKELGELGRELVNFHLLKSQELNNPISKFHGGNGNRVEKREYDEKGKRVYINKQQYFDNVESEIWNYYIGGYQVLDKWLKDRKGRVLSSEDIKHYCKVATALSKTIEIQKKIDELYPEVEKNLLK